MTRSAPYATEAQHNKPAMQSFSGFSMALHRGLRGGKTVRVLVQLRACCVVLGFEAVDESGDAQDLVDVRDALTAAPDVAPGLALGAATAAEAHLALVRDRQRIRVEP